MFTMNTTPEGVVTFLFFLAVLAVFAWLYITEDKTLPEEEEYVEKMYRGIDMAAMPEGARFEQVQWIRQQKQEVYDKADIKRLGKAKANHRVTDLWAQDQWNRWNAYCKRELELAEKKAALEAESQAIEEARSS